MYKRFQDWFVKYWYIAIHSIRKAIRRLYYGNHIVWLSDADKCDRCHGPIKYIRPYGPGWKRTGESFFWCERCGHKPSFIKIGQEWPYGFFRKEKEEDNDDD